jgi:microcystin degradation protein MlrC
MAARLWSKREAFRVQSLDGSQAVQKAQALVASGTSGPVVINETSDNCGGGAPGDGTHLLRAMLDARLGREACFAFVVDPVTAAQAHQAGTGKTIDVALGGRTDSLHGAPIVTSARVKSLSDGRLVLQAIMRGAPQNLGPMARLVIDDMDVVVASRRSQTFDPEPFLALGIDVRRYRYVALKSSNHFRAGFRDIAGAIVTADTPGLVTHNLGVFPRQSIGEPFWPLDERAAFSAGDLA